MTPANQFFRAYQPTADAKHRYIRDDEFDHLDPRPPLATVYSFTRNKLELTEEERDAVLYLCPGWWIDIDDEAPSHSCKVARDLLAKLEALDVPRDSVRLWLSGSKGVHMLVPPGAFMTDPGEPLQHLPAIMKEMTNGDLYLDGVDLRAYSRQQLWRQEGVKRDNGAFKVPVTAAELDTIRDDETYRALCAAPREMPSYGAARYSAALAYQWAKARDKVRAHEAKRPQRRAANKAAAAMLRDAELPTYHGLLSGSIKSAKGWNQTALQLASIALGLGWSEDELITRAAGAVRAHESDGRYNTPAKRERELRNQYRYQDGSATYEVSIPALLSLLPKGTPADDLRDLIADVPDHGFSVADLMTGHGKGGRLRSDVEALFELLRRDPRLSGLIFYDEFAQEAGVSAPMHQALKMAQAPSETGGLTDDHVLAIAHWFAREWRLKVPKDNAWSAVRSLALANSRNPPRERVQALAKAWDGEARLDDWLINYLNAETRDEGTGEEFAPYIRAVGTKWLISLVARVMKPGAQVDTMLVLSGAQGARKSSALRVVGEAFGASCYGDSFDISDRSKDRLLKLRGKIVVEWAEMAGLSKRDVREIKTFLTERNDEYRAPYDRAPRRWPRTAVFAASTNETEMLADETGARRFWVVPIGGLITAEQIARLRADIDQIIGEAAHRYQAGEKWWICDETEADLMAMTRERQEAAGVFTQFDQLALDLAIGVDEGRATLARHCDVPLTLSDWIPMKDVERMLVTLRGEREFTAAEWKAMSSALRRQGWEWGKRGKHKLRCYRVSDALFRKTRERV